MASNDADCEIDGFDDLVRHEARRIDQNDHLPEPTELKTSAPGQDREPRIVFTARDRLGLALSGGGIRSATFNLGVLQALARRYGGRSILDEVDYLSTVSGGGYIGGFWSRWLSLEHARKEAPATLPFPSASPDGDGAEIRSLREHSRFLVPRIGFSRAETWEAVIAVLGGTLPALAMAASTLALALYGWLLLEWLFLEQPLYAWMPSAAGGAATFMVHGIAEWQWRARNGDRDRRDLAAYLGLAFMLSLAASVAWWGWWFWWLWVDPYSEAWQVRPSLWGGTMPAYALFLPALVWTSLGVLMLILRGLVSRSDSVAWFRRMERCAARCFAPAVVWTTLAGVWVTANALRFSGDLSLGATAVGTVGSAGLFAWLRTWLAEPIVETRGSSTLGRLAVALKPWTPQLLANATVLGMLVCTAALLQLDALRVGPWIVIGVGITSTVLFDPTRVGLHDFYRSRIAASFLGAARGQQRPRTTEECPDDDVTLGHLAQTMPPRPLHLVCCTANNLSGDPLANLYRGGSSVSLSPVGVALGSDAAAMPQLRFSAVLTASAAAFNSQMGSFSMRLGLAVAFVMCALNLRLGLWVAHPALRRQSAPWFPGAWFFLEMLSRSQSTRIAKLPRFRRIHLSDGGHFENLALYELVRRHCRYIIVSDCGADANHQFNDLANAIRRIREDFGIEIELDTGPLMPGPGGYASQHAVIGTIHYDGAEGADKGTILYFKPVLVGEEPSDVQEYHDVNPKFPHESTGDQFYDEAQWESYRRLGEHSANMVFRFLLEHSPGDQQDFVDRLFLDVIERWQRPRAIDTARLRQLVERRDALIADVREHAPLALQAELLPLLSLSFGITPAPESQTDRVQSLFFCLRMAALMEEVWEAAALDTHWSHPTNQGWMSFFHTCASTASFRACWPLLRPFFGAAFRDFVKLRFGIRIAVDARPHEDPQGAAAHVSVGPTTIADLRGPAIDEWRRRHGDPDPGLSVLECRLRLGAHAQVPVGFLLYLVTETHIEWHSNHLYVPPALFGAGVTARFLDAILAFFVAKPLRVIVEDDAPQTGATLLPDTASGQARVRMLSFYKSRGFEQRCADAPRILDLSPRA